MPFVSRDPPEPFDETRPVWQPITEDVEKAMLMDWKLLQMFHIPDVIAVKLWDCRDGTYMVVASTNARPARAMSPAAGISSVMHGPMDLAKASIIYDNTVTEIAAKIVMNK